MTRQFVSGDEPLPGYRLIGFLGRGGFGEVWKASAPGGTLVALKIINLSAYEGQKELRALRLVKRVRHPNLVPILAFWLCNEEGKALEGHAAEETAERLAQATRPNDSWSEDEESRNFDRTVLLEPEDEITPKLLVMVMGLGDKNLFDRLKECQKEGLPGVPPDELLGYLEDAAKAIDHLNSPVHDLGSGPVAIQHCDIKPQNIMICSGVAQVCDFGLARALGDIRATSAAGSPAYAAPECLADNAPAPSTDQYSLAISYVELRTGSLPFSVDSFMSVLNAHLNGEHDFSRLSEPEQLVLRRATARNPAARYATTLKMIRDLRLAVEGHRPTGLDEESGHAVRESLRGTAKAPVSARETKRTTQPTDLRASVQRGMDNVDAPAPFSETIPLRHESGAAATERTGPAFANWPTWKLALLALGSVAVAAGVVFTIGLIFLSQTPVRDSEKVVDVKLVPTEAPPAIWLPPGYGPAEGAKLVTLKGQAYYDRVKKSLSDSEEVIFVLIPRKSASDPETFYILRDKVPNGVFALFAAAQPEAVRGSQWKLGALVNGQDQGAADPRLPVLRVSVEEAQRCCVWLGGRLPSARQWDKAAGVHDDQDGLGPFVSPWNQESKTEIAVNRADLGPLPIGTAERDRSVFGCRDMAGNGREWTRDIADIGGLEVPLAQPEEGLSVLLRSRDYADPAPLTYQILRSTNLAGIESAAYQGQGDVIGFRAVIEREP